MTIEAMKQALEALEIAQDNLRPHEDNCFLHDEGEYNHCFCGKDSLSNFLQEQVESLSQAIEQAEKQEPVAWMDGYRNIYSLEEKAAGCEDAVIPLVPAIQHWSDCAVHNEPAYPKGDCDCGGYTIPQPQREWVGLTDRDVFQIAEQCGLASVDWTDVMRAVEAKLKEKNT